MTDEPTTQEHDADEAAKAAARTRRLWLWILTPIITFAIVGGLMSRQKPSYSDASEADAPAKLACRHYRNVAQDAADGIYTMDELREKLIEVNNNAKYSETPDIASTSRTLLAAVTNGTFTTADVNGLLYACAAAGQ